MYRFESLSLRKHLKPSAIAPGFFISPLEACLHKEKNKKARNGCKPWASACLQGPPRQAEGEKTCKARLIPALPFLRWKLAYIRRKIKKHGMAARPWDSMSWQEVRDSSYAFSLCRRVPPTLWRSRRQKASDSVSKAL